MTAAEPSLRDEVTVVVITRDRAQMLRQALTSVRGQRGGPVDVVVVVDGSGDDTVEVLGAFPEVRVIRQRDAAGPAAARNAGLAAVRTPWVAFLDDDDVWAPDKLLAQHRALAAVPQARWCHTGAMALDAELRPIGGMHAAGAGDVRAAILAENVVCGGGSSVYAHTETVRAVGGFAADVRRHEDWDLWIRLALVSPLVAVDRPLVGFRRHAVSRSGVAVEGDADALLRRYADERRRLGVTGVSRHPLQALHDNPLVPGSSRRFARGYLRAGLHYRSPLLLAGAAGSLLWPRATAAVSRRHWRVRTPEAWFAEVGGWLPALAHVPAAPIPVSVVVPAYRRASMVGAAVRSALAQVPPPAEVVVVDDGSDDRTAEAAERAGARVVRLPHNRGEGPARNAGIEAASCAWVALLDSDDVWLPGHLARLWAAREGHVLVADSYVGSETGLRGGNPRRRPRVLAGPADLLWPWNGVAPSCALLPRADVLAAGGFRALPLGADLDFWLRLLERGRGLSLPAVGCVYREHAGQVTAGRCEEARRAVDALVAETAGRPWNTPALRRRVTAVAVWDRARAELRDGRRGAAARTLLGLGRRPGDVRAVVTVVRLRLRMRVRGRSTAVRLPGSYDLAQPAEQALDV